MRQSKKEIKDEAVIIELFNTSHVGRLGTISKDGYPIVKPLNFAYNPPLPPFNSPLSKGGDRGVKEGQEGFGKISAGRRLW